MRDFQKGDLVWFNDNLHTVSSVLYGAVCLEDWPDPVYDRSQLSPYSKPIVDCNAKADPEKIQEFADRAMGDREEPQWRSMETAPKKELLDIIAKGWYLRKDGTREEFGVSRIHWYKTRWDDDWGATFEPIGWMPWPTAEEPA